MNTYLSNKLKILSLIAMVLVVFIHSYIETTTNNTLMSEAIAFLQYFISQGVARVAVPIFFTISGYLYFLSYQNTTNDYIIKTKKRLKTLVLPYLLMSFFIVLCYTFILDPLFGHYINKSINIFHNSITDTLKVIFIDPLPYQLWFLRDLILLILLAPFIHYLFKFLKVYFIFILVLLWLPITSFSFYIFSNEAILFFSLGAYLTTQQDILLQKRKGNVYYLITLVWLLALTIKSIVNIKLGINNEISDILLKISIIMGGISIWSLYDISIKSETPSKILFTLSSYSFFIYLIHEPLLLSTFKKISNVIIRKNELFLPFFYFFNAIITIILCIIIAKGLQKYTPKLYSIITGGR